MNAALPPLDPDELDELLSADLDGELAVAARDRGSDVETIRARIAATPGAPARRAALSAARDLLARAPELDELVEARLRAKAVRAVGTRSAALDEARRARRKRALVTVFGIAAAVIVVAVIAVAVGRSGSPSTPNLASAPSSAPNVDVTKPVPALGSYSDARALGSVAVTVARQRASTQQRDDAVANGSEFGSPSAPRRLEPALSQPAATPAPSTLDQRPAYGSQSRGVATSGSGTATSATTGQAGSCAPAQFVGSGDQLVMSATATLDGRPVRVYVFSGNGEHTVVVLGASCVLVNVQTLH
jgi:hypothetical protein